MKNRVFIERLLWTCIGIGVIAGGLFFLSTKVDLGKSQPVKERVIYKIDPSLNPCNE